MSATKCPKKNNTHKNTTRNDLCTVCAGFFVAVYSVVNIHNKERVNSSHSNLFIFNYLLGGNSIVDQEVGVVESKKGERDFVGTPSINETESGKKKCSRLPFPSSISKTFFKLT
jgi:hypothetical protein